MEFPALSDSIFRFWKTIQRFSEIDIQPNTLVLCDIDDTLLHHPAINHDWMNLIHAFFYMQHYEITGTHDKNESLKKYTQFYDEAFNNIPLQHTDRDGFFAMVEKSTTFVFVTARQDVTRDFTYTNLRSLDIDPSTYKVHFSGSIAKGEYIMQNFELTKYEHVVFIDDQMRNVENVLSVVDHPGLEIYHFQRDKTNDPFDYYPLPPRFNPKFRFDGENLVRIGKDDDEDNGVFTD